jgi:ribosomal protein L29
MDFKELKEKSNDELTKVLGEQRAVRAHFRFHVATGQQKNMRVGREARKTIARILTIIKGAKNSTPVQK